MTEKDVSEMLTLPETAEYSGYNYSYLRDLVRKGEVETKRIGNMHLVTKSEAERLRHRRMRNL